MWGENGFFAEGTIVIGKRIWRKFMNAFQRASRTYCNQYVLLDALSLPEEVFRFFIHYNSPHPPHPPPWGMRLVNVWSQGYGKLSESSPKAISQSLSDRRKLSCEFSCKCRFGELSGGYGKVSQGPGRPKVSPPMVSYWISYVIQLSGERYAWSYLFCVFYLWLLFGSFFGGK